MMNVIIVDDEPLALEVLETYIAQTPSLQLVARCSNAIEAFEALNMHAVDLMFLDIQMPQITGIDFLKTLARPPKVIFTTAYPNYALDGYELNAVDYLLKPISLERFQRAVQKAQQRHDAEHSSPALPATATENAAAKEPEVDFIFVKADKKLIKIKFDDIRFIEGLKDYVILHTPSGRIVTLQTMKSLEDKLPPEHFMRVHRSYIVNLGKIEMMEANTLIIDKKPVPIGKNYKDELLNIINKNRL